MQKLYRHGFTLIELSIVLVIIGLIVGGILVGQELIHASEVRATITQIEKYNSAANSFLGKYAYLPGDIKDPEASSFGFAPRGSYAGEGDGNGLLEGVTADAAAHNTPHDASTGETAIFWVDLSAAHLIDNSFSAASTHVTPASTITASTTPAISDMMPLAKLGGGNYIFTYSGGDGTDGLNYYSLCVVNSLPTNGAPVSTTGLTVKQAYDIDRKIDDGLPQQGNVFAAYITTGGVHWAAGGGGTGAHGSSNTPTNGATAGTSATCYDNGSSSAAQQYSLQQGGSNLNCALSIRFQ